MIALSLLYACAGLVSKGVLVLPKNVKGTYLGYPEILIGKVNHIGNVLVFFVVADSGVP